LWQPTIAALLKKDQDLATEEKFKVEDRQREEARQREAEGLEWRPQLFKTTEQDGLDFILSTMM